MSGVAKELDAICTQVYSGGTPASKNEAYYGGEIPWLRTQEVTFNRIKDTDIKITEAGLNNSAAKWVPENSVIVAMYGNSAGRVSINEIPLTTNQACCNLVVDPQVADYRYVFYALKKSYEALKGQSRGAAQNNLNASQVKAFKILCPPVNTQNAIGNILSVYDDLIENNQRRIQLLEQAARLLYKEWFVHLRFPGHEHVKIKDDVPEGWSDGVVSDFYSTGSGGTPSRKNPDFYTGEIPWVKTQELTGDFITSTDEQITDEAIKRSSAKIYPRHAVLIAMYGATIGQAAILSVPAATNQACCVLTPKERGTSYVHAYLFFCYHKKDLVGLGQGAAQNNVSQQVIKSFRMVMPRKELLELFLEITSPFFGQIEILKKTNISLIIARDLLLPRLMNGEFVV